MSLLKYGTEVPSQAHKCRKRRRAIGSFFFCEYQAILSPRKMPPYGFCRSPRRPSPFRIDTFENASCETLLLLTSLYRFLDLQRISV